jgi:hypothetical protein
MLHAILRYAMKPEKLVVLPSEAVLLEHLQKATRSIRRVRGREAAGLMTQLDRVDRFPSDSGCRDGSREPLAFRKQPRVSWWRPVVPPLAARRRCLARNVHRARLDCRERHDELAAKGKFDLARLHLGSLLRRIDMADKRSLTPGRKEEVFEALHNYRADLRSPHAPLERTSVGAHGY